MRAPTNLKIYLASIFVGAVIATTPFKNKILLIGIILPIIIKLLNEIQKNNSFFLKNLLNKKPTSWIQHPWIIIIIIMAFWGAQ